MAILIHFGIAFGFFIGCSVVTPLFQDSGTGNPEALSEAELRQELEEVNQTISEEPGDAGVLYRKGTLLNSLARKQASPDDRLPLYRDMKETLTDARSADAGDRESRETTARIDELLRSGWGFEHNLGIGILQQDSTLSGVDYDDAVSHFNNAIQILPDSALSYEMKARAHYRNHQVEQAIETLELANSRIDPLPSRMLEQLAFLYLETEQPGMAVERYEQAETFSDDNLNLIHGLANAYISSGEHERSVELLQTLVSNEPDNVIYLEAYGNELYQLGMDRYDSVFELDRGDSTAVLNRSAEADSLMEMALEQYQRALNLNPENSELQNQLAAYYQNYAAVLNRSLPFFPEQYREEVEERIEEHLSNSITIFEELVSRNPENTDYWRHLYQAYSYLGMQQQAEEARTRANL